MGKEIKIHIELGTNMLSAVNYLITSIEKFNNNVGVGAIQPDEALKNAFNIDVAKMVKCVVKSKNL
jgi:hypothetical protein